MTIYQPSSVQGIHCRITPMLNVMSVVVQYKEYHQMHRHQIYHDKAVKTQREKEKEIIGGEEKERITKEWTWQEEEK